MEYILNGIYHFKQTHPQNYKGFVHRIAIYIRRIKQKEQRYNKHQKRCDISGSFIGIETVLLFNIRHLIIPHSVFTNIKEQICICICNGEYPRFHQSDDSRQDHQKNNRLESIQHASSHVPDITGPVYVIRIFQKIFHDVT